MRSNDVDHHCPDCSVFLKEEFWCWVIWFSALGVTVIVLMGSRLNLILKVSPNNADCMITESYRP